MWFPETLHLNQCVLSTITRTKRICIIKKVTGIHKGIHANQAGWHLAFRMLYLRVYTRQQLCQFNNVTILTAQPWFGTPYSWYRNWSIQLVSMYWQARWGALPTFSHCNSEQEFWELLRQTQTQSLGIPEWCILGYYLTRLNDHNTCLISTCMFPFLTQHLLVGVIDGWLSSLHFLRSLVSISL